MVRFQPDFFFKLSEHGLFRRLIFFDAALGELPGVLTYTATPEQPALVIAKDNPDIRAKAI
jgi:hypothetical protein